MIYKKEKDQMMYSKDLVNQIVDILKYFDETHSTIKSSKILKNIDLHNGPVINIIKYNEEIIPSMYINYLKVISKRTDIPKNIVFYINGDYNLFPLLDFVNKNNIDDFFEYFLWRCL